MIPGDRSPKPVTTGETTRSPRKVLAVIGGGPKAMALAAKARALRDVGVGDTQVVIIEEHAVAANWEGTAGFTDGEQPLGTPPEKDIAFPYKSIYGKTIDSEMIRYSWHMFLIESGGYSDWIDRGRPQPFHRKWAEYLKWVFGKAAPDVVIGKAFEVEVGRDELEISVRTPGGVEKIQSAGLVLTGPGEPLRIAGAQDEDPELILNGKNYWQRQPIFSAMKEGRVAVVGGGETAASIILSLLDRSPNLRIDLINRHGTIYTRGESFHENRLFSVTEEWAQMDDIDREEFIKRTDRGVFSVAAKRIIDQAMNVRTIAGHISEINSIGTKVNVKLQRKGNTSYDLQYDKIIVSIGFDPLSELRLISGYQPPQGKAEVRQFRRSVDQFLRAPLKLRPGVAEAPDVNIHLPMVAGLAQGPGFPNLSCLGTMADRIFSLYSPP